VLTTASSSSRVSSQVHIKNLSVTATSARHRIEGRSRHGKTLMRQMNGPSATSYSQEWPTTYCIEYSPPRPTISGDHSSDPGSRSRTHLSAKQ